MVEYRVAAGRRYTPCNGRKYQGVDHRTKFCYGTAIRVKIAEPGVYERTCDRCGGAYWFLLEVSAVPGEQGILKLRWIDAIHAAGIIAASQIDGPDLEDLVKP